MLLASRGAPARPAHRLGRGRRRCVPRRPPCCSASPRASSTPTTSCCSRRSPPRSSAPAWRPRSAAACAPRSPARLLLAAGVDRASSSCCGDYTRPARTGCEIVLPARRAASRRCRCSSRQRRPRARCGDRASAWPRCWSRRRSWAFDTLGYATQSDVPGRRPGVRRTRCRRRHRPRPRRLRRPGGVRRASAAPAPALVRRPAAAAASGARRRPRLRRRARFPRRPLRGGGGFGGGWRPFGGGVLAERPRAMSARTAAARSPSRASPSAASAIIDSDARSPGSAASPAPRATRRSPGSRTRSPPARSAGSTPSGDGLVGGFGGRPGATAALERRAARTARRPRSAGCTTAPAGRPRCARSAERRHDEHRPLGVVHDRVRDAAEQHRLHRERPRAPSTISCGVELVGDVEDRAPTEPGLASSRPCASKPASFAIRTPSASTRPARSRTTASSSAISPAPGLDAAEGVGGHPVRGARRLPHVQHGRRTSPRIVGDRDRVLGVSEPSKQSSIAAAATAGPARSADLAHGTQSTNSVRSRARRNAFVCCAPWHASASSPVGETAPD